MFEHGKIVLDGGLAPFDLVKHEAGEETYNRCFCILQQASQLFMLMPVAPGLFHEGILPVSLLSDDATHPSTCG